MRIGRHWLGDLSGCDPELLRNEEALNALFEKALNEAGAQILSFTSHRFGGGGGVTGIFLLAESHASYHTYPEFGYLAVDFFTCGQCDPEAIAAIVIDALAPTSQATQLTDRTIPVEIRHGSGRTNRPAGTLREAI